ncbi:hypothetical protein [Devosia sp. 919]|uniref:hypothetical protein n=1 Tax=Devosia sp. 919 TaxID=2726065 RepID=UPI00155657B9|nr:hypothetical protein [Devosia sp. 919]
MELTWEAMQVGRQPNSNLIFGLDELSHLMGRYVYVIETPRDLAIQYADGISNVCYIGRQGERSQGNRLLIHGKGWISRFLILAQSDLPFTVHFCHPRRRNMVDAYKDIEAFLIREFEDVFGSPPLFNKRRESELAGHEVTLNSNILRRRHKGTVCKIDARGQIEPDALSLSSNKET